MTVGMLVIYATCNGAIACAYFYQDSDVVFLFCLPLRFAAVVQRVTHEDQMLFSQCLRRHVYLVLYSG